MAEIALPTFLEMFERESRRASDVIFDYDSVYRKGIRSWAFEIDKGRVDVWGTVEEKKASHEVTVTIDTDVHELISYSCSCSQHKKQKGICDHAIALGYNYLRFAGFVSSPYSYTKPSDAPVPRPAPQAKRLPSVRTSPKIKDLVKAYANQSLERMGESADEGKQSRSQEDLVRLTCVIATSDTYWRNSWSEDIWVLGLKVSRGKATYVVKDIGDLVEAWRTCSYYSYGKNLAFTHDRRLFSDQANTLLEMLAPVVDAQVAFYGAQESRNRSSSSYYYEDVPRVPSKTLPLSTVQLIAVLDLMQGSQVVVETRATRYSQKKNRRTVTVHDGTPAITVSLTPEREGSYDLTLRPNDLECVMADGVLYLLGKDTVCRCGDDFTKELGTFCLTMLPMPEKPLHIREADLAAFCGSVLPALERHTTLKAPEEMGAYMPATPEFTFKVGLDHGFVSCEATVAYGADELPLFYRVYEGQPVRNVELELAAQALVGRFFENGVPDTPNYGSPYPKPARTSRTISKPGPEPHHPWFEEEDDEAYFLLFSEGLRALSTMGEVLLSERLRGRTIREAPQVRVDARIRSGLLDIQVTSDDMDTAELVAYLASYRRKQRYVRLDSGDLVLLDGSVASIAGLADGLGMEADELVRGATGLPANRTLFVDAMLKRAPGVRYERNRAFRRIVRDFETIADADFVPPVQLREVLRPYQEEGFKWLCTLGSVGFGGILADEMGLGKTVQAIAYLDYRRLEGETRPAIVVCPASLVYNWRSEIERFAPDMSVVCVTGDKRRRRAAIAQAQSADVLITSYDLMRRDVSDYEDVEFSCAILDEAQFVKNHRTQAAKAVRTLNATVRFALTGTPIENRLLELWSIFDFLMPGVLGSDAEFTQRFATPITDGDEVVAERLRRLVGPFILRRLKRDVAQDLPEKNESVVVAQMQGEQDKLYRASASRLALMLSDQTPAEFAGQRLKVLAELTKLRQICCDPHLLYENYKGDSAKLDTCMELVHQAVDGGHQVLLFSQFTSMLEIISDRLDREKVTWFKLTGSTSKEARVKLVERFQAGEASVFLISLKAGGTGLNLTAADIVIHYDPWWNLAAQNQATDRTHRIGQDKEVSVFKLIAQDTIEEKIVALQEAKRDLAETVLAGDATGGARITQEDLLALLDQS